MADQPDWQRFQSSNAPYLYNETSAAPVGKQNVYVGPWRAMLLDAGDSGNGEVWDMLITWANDAARTQIVQQVPIILSTGFSFVGWIPVMAPYMTVGVTATVPAAGQQFQGSLLPTLLDPPTQGRYLPRPMISTIGSALNHNNFANNGALYFTAGPARLTVRTTGYSTTFALQSMASNGTWSTFMTYQPGLPNTTVTYEVTLPYNPVRVQVLNSEAFQQITYDLRLEPA